MAQASRLCGGRVCTLDAIRLAGFGRGRPGSFDLNKAVERLLRTRRALGKRTARPQLAGGSGVGRESAYQLTLVAEPLA